MEFNGLWILAAVVWFLVNLISKAQRKPEAGQRPKPREPMRPGPLPTTPDATQLEGSRLEQMLRELQRSLETASEAGRPRQPSPVLEQPDEARSLEVDPEVRSLEGEVRREVRRQVDQDDEAADIEAQRIRAAAARTSAIRGERAIADQSIKQQPADHTATRTYTPQQLRDAIVWREILGRPVSER